MNESYDKTGWLIVILGILVIASSSAWGVYRAGSAVVSAEPAGAHFALPVSLDRPFCWMSNRPIC